ncbi:hypothetical protein PtB15_18B288 [Puccinia triticina]|nr:hypothetical protein PtB15_18B288 [Puccinia triticina]
MSPQVDCFSSGSIGPQLGNLNHTSPQANQGISSFGPRVPERFDWQHNSLSSPLPPQMGFDPDRNRDQFPVEHHHHQRPIDRSLSSSIAPFNHWLHSGNQPGPPLPGASTLLPAFREGLARVPAPQPSLSHQSSVGHCTVHPLPLRPTGFSPIPPSNTQTINHLPIYSAPAGVIRNLSLSPPDHSSWQLPIPLAGVVAPPHFTAAQASLGTNRPADSGSASLSYPIQNGRAHPLPQATDQSIQPLQMQLPPRRQAPPLAIILPKQINTNRTPLRLNNHSLDLLLPGTIPSGCSIHHPRDRIAKRSADTTSDNGFANTGRKGQAYFAPGHPSPL